MSVQDLGADWQTDPPYKTPHHDVIRPHPGPSSFLEVLMNGEISAVPVSDTLPHVAVFGLDESRKAHASVFNQSDTASAQKAAGLMGMHVLLLDSREHRAVAQGCAKGRLFESGKAFVPFVKRALYERLCVLGGVDPNEVAGPQREANNPEPVEEKAEAAPPVDNFPEDWSRIRQGSLVLAVDAPEDGWFEAVVTETKPDGLHVLVWRDFADYPPFARHTHELALVHPHARQSEEAGQ